MALKTISVSIVKHCTICSVIIVGVGYCIRCSRLDSLKTILFIIVLRGRQSTLLQGQKFIYLLASVNKEAYRTYCTDQKILVTNEKE